MNSYDEELMLQEDEQVISNEKKDLLTPSSRVVISQDIINNSHQEVQPQAPHIEDEEVTQNQISAPARVTVAPAKISNVTEHTEFSKVVDQAKINIVNEAAATDEKFINQVKEELKSATIKLAEVEKSKAQLEQQNIDYHSELLKTKQELNEHLQAENKWTNREKRRQYHFNGVLPIMSFVGIKTPMNLAFLYLLTVIILPFFLLSKLWRGTVGALIAGAEDADRSKAVKGFIWTLLGILALALTFLVIYLMLGWLGII